MQTLEVIINGVETDQLSSLDRGINYGDGIFETIAVKQGVLQYWDDHLQRLQLGCEVLKLQDLDAILLKKEINQLIASDTACVIKVIITRGIGERGYKPTNNSLTRIVQKFPWPEFPSSYCEKGVEVTQCKFQLSQQSALSRIKHLNRLEQVLARSEWDGQYQEGLVCDVDNNVIEATSSNIFFELEDKLITPNLVRCGVAGVIRKRIIDYCQDNNIAVEVRDFKQAELSNIQAMFLCNSIIGVWPVAAYCERRLSKTAIIDRLIAEFNS